MKNFNNGTQYVCQTQASRSMAHNGVKVKGRKNEILGLTVLSLVLIFFISNFVFLKGADAATKIAPNFNLRVLNPVISGYTKFSPEKFKGHVIIINFWATWCPPCRHEIPMIEKFYKSERSNGLIVLGINVNNSIGGVRSFVKNYNITYPTAYATSVVISDYGGVNEIPQTFFISRSGKIMFHWVGEITSSALYGITNKLLKME